MEKKIFFAAFIILALSVFALLRDDQAVQIIDENTSYQDEAEVRLPTDAKSLVDSEAAVEVVAYPDSESEYESEFPPTHEEDLMIEKALADIEAMKQIPGAARLVEEITERLQNDPGAITFENFNEDGAIELDGNFMKKMIPDEELREKWIELIDLVVANAANAQGPQ